MWVRSFIDKLSGKTGDVRPTLAGQRGDDREAAFARHTRVPRLYERIARPLVALHDERQRIDAGQETANDVQKFAQSASWTGIFEHFCRKTPANASVYITF
jgi:hypothetical protein